MTPRILFVDHSGALGGAELYLRDVIRHYSQATLVTFEEGDFPETMRAEGARVETLDSSRGLRSVEKSSGLLALLRAVPGVLRTVGRLISLAQSHDVVFLNSQKALFPGALAGWLTRTPTVWSLHDILTADHFSSLTRRVATRWANAFVDLVLVNSEATRAAFAKSGGREGKTRLVYNGIDPSPFEATDKRDVHQLRQTLGIADVPCVGVFSRLAPWKGQHVLLDAAAQLPDVHVLLVGDALFQGDVPYKTALHQQVERLNLDERVHFTGFRSDIPALMQAVDVVAHTSTEPEPFGRVIVEGLLAGRPVVAAGAGGALEIITDEVTGRLTPPGNADALADTLSDLLESPDRARSLAERGQAMAKTRFSLTEMRTAIDGYVHQVIADS